MDELKIDERIQFCWVDIETTGLEANVDIPLEVGLKLTDVHGFSVAEESWLLHEANADWVIQRGVGAAHPIVGPMHQKLGLWDDLLAARDNKSAFTREELDDEMIQWLQDNGAPVGLGMTGNSTGSLDRPFTLVHFPKLNEYLGYRNIDMSTLKELCKKINPGLWANLAPIIGGKADAPHRVLGDIDACITEYRTYCENFLMTGDEF